MLKEVNSIAVCICFSLGQVRKGIDPPVVSSGLFTHNKSMLCSAVGSSDLILLKTCGVTLVLQASSSVLLCRYMKHSITLLYKNILKYNAFVHLEDAYIQNDLQQLHSCLEQSPWSNPGLSVVISGTMVIANRLLFAGIKPATFCLH